MTRQLKWANYNPNATAAACHQEKLVSIRCFVKARKEQKIKAINVLAILRKFYDDGRKSTVEWQVAQ